MDYIGDAYNYYTICHLGHFVIHQTELRKVAELHSLTCYYLV